MFLSNGMPFAPQSLAEIRPIIPEAYYYPDHMGLDLEYQFALYGKMYRSNPTLYAVINKRADAVARLPVNIWDVEDGTRVLDTDSPYAKLMAEPCPFMTNYEFFFWVQMVKDVYGEAYLAMVMGDDGPKGFMPMHPSRTAIKRNPKTGRYTYFFQAGSGIGTELVSFDEDEIVPIKHTSPDKLERGFSPMEALRQTIFAEDSARNAVESLWRNGIRPNVVVESDKTLSDTAARRLQTAIQNAHGGSGNTGRTLVLENGVTAKPVQLSTIDLQLIESRKLNRQEICAAYDIAPTLVADLQYATFSNITEQMRSFYRDTMAPVIESIQAAIDKYVGSYWSRKNIMRFAVDEVIKGDYEKRAESAQHLVTCGVMTPNEGRDLIGLNKYDDPKADLLYANSAIQLLGQPAEQLRIAGQLDGYTADGQLVVPTGTAPVVPSSIPVANLSGNAPTIVPRLPAGQPRPALPAPAPAAPPSGQRQPGNTTPSSPPKSVPKHLHAVKSALGRKQDIKAFAMKLAEQYPDELEDVLESVRMAIQERDARGAA